MKKKTILCIIGILLIAVIGGFFMIRLIEKNKWEKQTLEMYKMRSSGNKQGGSEEIKLSKKEEGAILTISSAEWYYEDPTVEEYLVDGKALDEIKEVFIKHGMYKWGDKKISDVFVADGATTSYLFSFTDDDLSFSSQLYPESYSSKLDEIEAIIEKYKSAGTKQR